MNHLPSHPGTFACVLAAGLSAAAFLPSAAAQAVDASPTAAPTLLPAQSSPAAVNPALATGPAHPDAKGRHLAPPGTFFLLSYVAVKTNDGVEGFDPGQEVHFVEAHRATHTLVVSDGHAQVEVPPSKLTNDMDIAALARQKDEANQARIAAYTQAEQAASAKFEREAADATAKDLAQRRQEQAAETQPAAPPQVAQSAQSPDAAVAADAADSADGYYGLGGYGYGSPYSYFVVRPGDRAQKAPAAAPVAAQAAAPGKVAEPEGGHAAGGRPK